MWKKDRYYLCFFSLVCFDSDSICATALSKMEAQETAIDYRMANSKCERIVARWRRFKYFQIQICFTHKFYCELMRIRSFEIILNQSKLK